MTLEIILRRARQQMRRMLRTPQYRVCLEDGIITEEDLTYLAMFEATRETVYEDTEGIIERVWEEFARIMALTPQEAEGRWLAIEDRTLTHYHNNLAAFGNYTHRFRGPKQ